MSDRPNFAPRPRFEMGAPVAFVDDAPVHTITTREPCPVCDGEGTVETEKPGGTWNSHIGTWEPDSYVSKCETCDGSGHLTVTRCGRCGRVHETDESGVMANEAGVKVGEWCDCDEDDLVEWRARLTDSLRTLERIAQVSHDAEALGFSTPAGMHGFTVNELHFIAALHGVRVVYLTTAAPNPRPFVSATVRVPLASGETYPVSLYS